MTRLQKFFWGYGSLGTPVYAYVHTLFLLYFK